MTIQLLITDEPPYLHLTLQYYGFPRGTSAGFLELLSRNLPNKYVNFNYKAKDICFKYIWERFVPYITKDFSKNVH